MAHDPARTVRAASAGLIICVAALLALGLVMVYSATMPQWGTYYLTRQLLWAVLGLGACVIAASIEYRLLRRVAWLVFALAVALLALILVSPLGIARNGAVRWFGYGRTSLFQPSEFAKLALILILAWYADRYQRQMKTCWRGLVVPGLLICFVAGLVFVEPDFGTAILIAGVGGAMLIVAGVRFLHILPVGLAGLTGLVAFMIHNPKCIERVWRGWVKLSENKDGAAYQAYQAMLAFGSGGWKGLGLGNSRQKLGFLPEHHTDFIFSILGEELGLVTLLVVVCFVIFVICGTCIARNARDTFGTLLAFGITFWIGLQAAINIGVVTSALPNKGLPLPFISYGGSNLTVALGGVGVLLSIALRSVRSDVVAADAIEAVEIPEPALSRC